MMYEVVYTLQAVKELKKLDKQTRTFILAWIEKIWLAALTRVYMEKG